MNPILSHNQRLRRRAKGAYVALLRCIGLLRWAKSRVAKRGLVVLTFHRVLRDADYDVAISEPGMLVRASTFNALLQYLKNECQCVDVENGEPEPTTHKLPRVGVTFDDGWKDNFEVAWPLLSQHGIKCAIFVCPELVTNGTGLWMENVNQLWHSMKRTGGMETLGNDWRNHFDTDFPDDACLAIARLKEATQHTRESFLREVTHALSSQQTNDCDATASHLMGWAEICEMEAAGVCIGSHTATHQILTRVAEPVAVSELSSSRSAIMERLNQCSMLAYPNGDWSGPVRNLVAHCGYERAFANRPGIWKQETHPLSIPRINIWEGKLTDSRGRFSRAQLEYSIFWKALWNDKNVMRSTVSQKKDQAYLIRDPRST